MGHLILTHTWENILVRINEVEGGITKFFEEYKTADRLLNRFIIPGVMSNNKSASEELEEMFLNYAIHYAEQEKELHLKSQIMAFIDKLQGILPLIKNMWDAEDARIQAIHILTDYLFTLEHNIRQNTDEKARLEAVINSFNEKLRHIQIEKASKAYYHAKENHTTTEKQLSEITQKKNDAKSQYDKYKHQIIVLNATKEYADLIKQQNQKIALYTQLRELEQGNMDKHILSLKYSLFISANKLKQHDDAEYQQEEEKIHCYSDMLQKYKQSISELTKKISDENEKCNKTIGSKETLLKQVNDVLNSLDVHITMMLDEHYSLEDINNIRSDYTAQLSEAVNMQKSYENEEQLLEKELVIHDEKRNDLIQQQADIKIQLQNSETELLQYQESYNTAMQVMEHLSLSSERIFSDEPLSCLNTIIEQLQEKLRKSERSAELLTEQLRLIENGQLHISKTAVSFLQETGISFQTGEHYLLCQSSDVRETILAVNPLVAYAVIVDSAMEKEKLLCQAIDDIWLSAIVPVYTISELADMADKKWNVPMQILSAYDKIYFFDYSAYSERIQTELTNVQAEIQHIRNKIEEWQSEQNVLLQFSYSADDEQKMLVQVDSYQETLNGIQNTISNLDSQRNEIQGRIKELRKIQSEQQEKITAIPL